MLLQFCSEDALAAVDEAAADGFWIQFSTTPISQLRRDFSESNLALKCKAIERMGPLLDKLSAETGVLMRMHRSRKAA